MALVDPNSLTLAAIDGVRSVETTSPLQNADRITAVLMFHFEQKDQPVISVDARYNSLATPTTEPYVRRVSIAEAWAPLDVGWVTNPATVLIINKGESDIWLHLGNEDNHLKIKPKHFNALGADNSTKLFIRSSSGPSMANVHVFPG